MKERSKKIKFWLVNIITFTRVIGSIIMPIIYFTKGIETLVFFVVTLFLTDFIDGKLSRIWKVESFLGSLLDSVSDKLFAFVMLGILSYEYPGLLSVLTLEFIIFVINTLAFSEFKNVQSSKIGKLKTFIMDASLSILCFFSAKDLLGDFLGQKFIKIITKIEYSTSYILIGIMFGIGLVTVCDYSKKRLKQVTKYEKMKYKQLKNFKEIWKILTTRETYINNKNKSLKELLYKEKSHK
ncbi:MAG: CDP-alcohol phosphatidyltransferase family protein [Bacilli bacterium]|nr:CDP-alcohol phosphatidyltransferase family protein [Bacilli bacterium]